MTTKIVITFPLTYSTEKLSDEKCSAWVSYLPTTMTYCAEEAVVDVEKGILEEVLLHEGCHANIDQLLEKSKAWRCAQYADKNFISSYAKGNDTEVPEHPEDVAESFLPWFVLNVRKQTLEAATNITINLDNLDNDDINEFTATIPNRLRVLSDLLTKPNLSQIMADFHVNGTLYLDNLPGIPQAN